MDEARKTLLFGILAVIGGTLIHFTFGYFYTIANMIPYMYSYLKVNVNPDIRERDFVWMSAIALGVQGITMPLGGLLARKIGFRIVVAMSCLFDCGGILLTHFSIKHSFALTVVTYSLILGAGLGFGYSVVLATASSWFPARRGLVVGIIVGGFGIGALIFTPIQTGLINPNNVKVNATTRVFEDPDVLDRIPRAFLILGTILFLLQVIGLSLLRPKPQPTKLAETKAEEAEAEGHLVPKGDHTETQLVADSGANELNLGPKMMLKSMDFYLLWLVMFFNIIPITIITSAFKLFGQKYISDDIFLSGVATVSSLFNAGGRIIWGAIVDKLSFKIPLCIMFSLWAVVLVTFPHLSLATGVTLKVLYAIWVCLLFFSLSGVFAIMPAATSIIFGPANLAINYGLIFNAFFAGSMICALFNTLLPSKDAYLQQFTGCACVCIMGLFTVVWIYDRRISRRLNLCKFCSGTCRRLRHDGDDDESIELHAR